MMDSLRINFRRGVRHGDRHPRLCRDATGPRMGSRSAWPAWPVWMIMLILGLSIPACSHWRESYLDDALRTVSQDKIIDRLGEPWKKKSSIINGQSTWIYRYSLTDDELDPMGVNALGQGIRQTTDTVGALIRGGGNAGRKNELQCFHYVLTFDKAGVLTRWRREECANTSL